MRKWKKNFKSHEEAEKYLKEASHDTKRQCFVKRVHICKNCYRIFSSLNEYQNYLAYKTK